MFRKQTLAILFSAVVLLWWGEATAAGASLAEPKDRDHSQENEQAPGETVTVVGVINNTYQLVTQNYEVFDIAETEAGNALIRLVNARVKVIGIVNEFEGQQLLQVLSFERITD